MEGPVAQEKCVNIRAVQPNEHRKATWRGLCASFGVLVFLLGCAGNLPKSDICGTEEGWSSMRKGKRYPLSFSKAVMRECDLNKCQPAHYTSKCKPLIELSDMSLAPEDGALDQKLKIHIEFQSAILAKHIARRWRDAIEGKLIIPKYLNFLRHPALEHWEGPARAELESIQEGIQALPDGEFRELFIELYVVAEQYDAIAYDQSGYSLLTYEAKIDELDAKASELLSRLKFAR